MVSPESHPSKHATAKLMTGKPDWHGMNKDVHTWAYNCIPCHPSKTTCHVKSNCVKFPEPKNALDTSMTLPVLFQYYFTNIHSSHWPEAIPTKEATTQSRSAALLFGWISRFGVPDISLLRCAFLSAWHCFRAFLSVFFSYFLMRKDA